MNFETMFPMVKSTIDPQKKEILKTFHSLSDYLDQGCSNTSCGTCRFGDFCDDNDGPGALLRQIANILEE